MDRRQPSGTPIVAIFLLLLVSFYLASYLCLVEPGGVWIDYADGDRFGGHYRFGQPVSGMIYLPLEKLDRWLRPGSWLDLPPGAKMPLA